MTTTPVVVLVACLLSVASAKLDGLKVTWGIDPFSKYTFADIPRVVGVEGWKEWKEDKNGCEDGTSNFLGRRFVAFDRKLGEKDYAVMPIFDVNGFIAGIQGAIPDNLRNDWPKSNIQPPFHHDKDLGMYTMTAYFVDPSIICTTGRTQQEFDEQGTGDRVVFQNGKELMVQPNLEADIGTTAWTKGQCFYTMGQHYWYNVTKEMSCDDVFPAFLMYNRGKLNSFGWAYLGDIDSPRYEHPTAAVLDNFFPKEYPDCLREMPAFSTLHIYLTDYPLLNFC